MANTTLNKNIHDVRGYLNRISMQAELVKLLLSQEAAPEKMVTSLNTILDACEQCNNPLSEMSDLFDGES